MAQIKGILFDKDGVLFDFQKTWGGWAEQVVVHFAEGDPVVAEKVAAKLGYDLQAGRVLRGGHMVAHTGPETAAHLSDALPGHNVDAVFAVMEDFAHRAAPVETVPLVPLFDDLHARGLRVGLATNGSEAEASAQLGALNVIEHFDFFAGFDSGYGAKPAPGMCLGFAKAMDLSPDALVMVGDSTHDMEAGRAAGFTCVAVLTGVATEADLAPHADVVLPDIGALPGWLEGGTA